MVYVTANSVCLYAGYSIAIQSVSSISRAGAHVQVNGTTDCSAHNCNITTLYEAPIQKG